jgi:hypothetical protein
MEEDPRRALLPSLTKKGRKRSRISAMSAVNVGASLNSRDVSIRKFACVTPKRTHPFASGRRRHSRHRLRRSPPRRIVLARAGRTRVRGKDRVHLIRTGAFLRVDELSSARVSGQPGASVDDFANREGVHRAIHHSGDPNPSVEP